MIKKNIKWGFDHYQETKNKKTIALARIVCYYNKMLISRLEISYYDKNWNSINCSAGGMNISDLPEDFEKEEINFLKEDPILSVYSSFESGYVNFIKFSTLSDSVYSLGKDEYRPNANYDVFSIGSHQPLRYTRGVFSGKFFFFLRNPRRSVRTYSNGNSQKLNKIENIYDNNKLIMNQ